MPGYALKQGNHQQEAQKCKKCGTIKRKLVFTVSELKGEAENCLILPQLGMCVEQSKFFVTLKMSMNDNKKS